MGRTSMKYRGQLTDGYGKRNIYVSFTNGFNNCLNPTNTLIRRENFLNSVQNNIDQNASTENTEPLLLVSVHE